MGAKKSRQPAATGVTLLATMRLLARPQQRSLVLTALVIGAAVATAVYGWQRWGAPAIKSRDYVVTPERIIVTPQPAWIHADVKAEVVRTLGSQPLALSDRRLVEHLAQAFALHPWVARVERIEKRYPARVHVTLQYRRPVLVVKMDTPDDQGLLFLDAEAVLLPSADFAPSQARDYLRIAAAGEAPAGSYGAAWGSERMAGAARVAAAIGNRWQPLGLFWLSAFRPPSGDLVYELRTQDDRIRVIWGAATSGESANEPTAEEKIRALERYVHDKGPLNREGAGAAIDLRELARGPVQTATAVQR